MNHHRFRTLAVVAVALAVSFTAVSCSQQAKAERDGRDLAGAACDFRHATTAEEAQAAKADFTGQLQDIAGRYGAVTAEDRRDIQNNLADLAEHATQGNSTLIRQDLAVLARSAEHIRNDLGEVQKSAWSGFADGIEECLQK